MKDNMENLIYYIFYIPALVISAVFLNLIMPIQTCLNNIRNKTYPQAKHPDESHTGNNLTWSEVQKVDRNAVNISAPYPAVKETTSGTIPDNTTPAAS